jgi:hypothetical protein
MEVRIVERFKLQLCTNFYIFILANTNINRNHKMIENGKTDISNTKYESYVFNSESNSPIQCLDNYSQKTRGTGIRPADISTDSILSGRGSSLYGEVKKPAAVVPDFTNACTNAMSKSDRDVRVNKGLSEREVISYNFQSLPTDISSQYRTFDFINSRQIVKDIKEDIFKRK